MKTKAIKKFQHMLDMVEVVLDRALWTGKVKDYEIEGIQQACPHVYDVSVTLFRKDGTEKSGFNIIEFPTGKLTSCPTILEWQDWKHEWEIEKRYPAIP